MDAEIIRQDGDTKRFSELGVTVQDFIVSSIEVEGVYGSVEGRAGNIDYGAEIGSRTISVPFFYKAADLHDFPLLRDELFDLVISQESFYIRELRRLTYQTGDNLYVGGKQYLVRIAGDFDMDQEFCYGFGEVAFETTELPFAESIGTTQDIEDNGGITYSAELWSYGMGLMHDIDSHKYSHSSNSFRIYNAGNIAIHPFEHSLKITIDNPSEGYELRNVTTGDKFEFNGEDTGELVIDGANITVYSLQALRVTNRRYITLKPGWNEFSQNQSREVKFDFKFYYK